jgi:hypothetical protein
MNTTRRAALALLLAGTTGFLLSACGKSASESAAAVAGPSALRVSEAGQVRNGFLFEHNAQFNGGRTFRWVSPIPIYILGPVAATNQLVLDQFLAWEAALSGVVSTPFYEPLDVGGSQIPSRGILFERHMIPPQPGCPAPPTGFIIGGCSNPFQSPDQPPQLPLAEHPRLQVSVPEVGADGQIQTCVSQIDPLISTADSFTMKFLIRHEIGRCLGFLGTVPRGVMAPTCCTATSSLAITPDVTGMMRTLYRLPPGTTVSQ